MRHNHKRWMQSLFLPTVRHFHSVVWQPAADVYRTPKGWLVKLDLAGIQPDKVSLSAEGRTLTIRGCRRDHFAEEHGHSHYRMEIAYSHFERTIELPFELDPARVSTDYRDGMLLISIQMETTK